MTHGYLAETTFTIPGLGRVIKEGDGHYWHRHVALWGNGKSREFKPNDAGGADAVLFLKVLAKERNIAIPDSSGTAVEAPKAASTPATEPPSVTTEGASVDAKPAPKPKRSNKGAKAVGRNLDGRGPIKDFAELAGAIKANGGRPSSDDGAVCF